MNLEKPKSEATLKQKSNQPSPLLSSEYAHSLGTVELRRKSQVITPAEDVLLHCFSVRLAQRSQRRVRRQQAASSGKGRGERRASKMKPTRKYDFYMKQPLLTNSSLSQRREHASGKSC